VFTSFPTPAMLQMEVEQLRIEAIIEPDVQVTLESQNYLLHTHTSYLPLVSNSVQILATGRFPFYLDYTSLQSEIEPVQ